MDNLYETSMFVIHRKHRRWMSSPSPVWQTATQAFTPVTTGRKISGQVTVDHWSWWWQVRDSPKTLSCSLGSCCPPQWTRCTHHSSCPVSLLLVSGSQLPSVLTLVPALFSQVATTIPWGESLGDRSQPSLYTDSGVCHENNTSAFLALWSL
jgi:hypothetical protein